MSSLIKSMIPIKIGLGEDSHRFTKKPKTLMLGGVAIKDAPGLLGNSDADVILHALCNAFDVVAGQGSIANYSDPMCQKGITASDQYLQHIQNIAHQKNWQVANASISVEALKPHLEEYSSRIKERLAALLEISPEDVGLTFTSGEKLSSFGRGEGIRASAIVVFQQPKPVKN